MLKQLGHSVRWVLFCRWQKWKLVKSYYCVFHPTRSTAFQHCTAHNKTNIWLKTTVPFFRRPARPHSACSGTPTFSQQRGNIISEHCHNPFPQFLQLIWYVYSSFDKKKNKLSHQDSCSIQKTFQRATWSRRAVWPRVAVGELFLISYCLLLAIKYQNFRSL